MQNCFQGITAVTFLKAGNYLLYLRDPVWWRNECATGILYSEKYSKTIFAHPNLSDAGALETITSVLEMEDPTLLLTALAQHN